MKAALVWAVALALIPCALGLQCYHQILTDSDDEPTQTKMCPLTARGCTKVRVEGDNLLVEYDCAGKSESEEDCATTKSNGRKRTACYCEGNLCNGSDAGAVAQPILALALALISYKMSH